MRTRLWILVFGWLMLSLPGQAQDEAPDGPPDDQAQTTDSQDSTESQDDGGEDSTDVDDFNFSEEIPADEQLVFPVDI